MRQRLLFVMGAGLLLSGVAPAAAQTRFDLGVNGGFSWWSPFVGDTQTGNGSVAFKTGWLVGAQATAWITERIGLRPNFAYENRGLKASDGTLFTGANGEGTLDHVKLFAPSVDLLFRLKNPSDEFVRGEWVPYVALGGGARWLRPDASDQYTAFDFVNGEVWPGVPFGIQGTSVDTLFLSKLSEVMGLVALGSDVRLAPHFAVRLEVGDRIQKPYAYAVTPLPGGKAFEAVSGHDNDASLSHDVYGIVGLHLTFGGTGAAAPVVVAPPPPPPPAQQPPPPPPPAPREEMVSVCVIDPAAAGGMRTASTIYLPDTRDTMVVVNGQRVAFRTTVPTVTTAEGADWLIAGRPLEIAVRPGPARFLPVGQAQTMGEGSLVLLGTLNGMPVYANRTDVAAVAAQLGTTGELTTVLGNADVRKAFDAVQTLYVPYRTVGCSFQPLQRQEEVRKQ